MASVEARRTSQAAQLFARGSYHYERSTAEKDAGLIQVHGAVLREMYSL